MRKIVIAGAGVLGAAIGWRLAQAGHKVTLVDPTPGGVASPGSFAWLNASFAEDPVYNRLRNDSLEIWRAMKAGDPSVPVEFAGAILWEQPHFDLPAIAASQAEMGSRAEMLDGAAVKTREPAVTDLPERALFLPGDGYGDPVAITRWFLDQAEANGASILKATLTGVDVARGRVTGVETTERPLAADHVVFATGVKLREVLAPLGLDLAMDNEPGLLARTSPGTSEITSMLATPEVHIWQRTDGGFLIGADFGGGGAFDDADAAAARVLEELHGALDGTEDCEVRAVTVRERPKPLDGRPAIGPLGPEGLYIVCTHSGMTLAPVIGDCVAREIGEGLVDARLAPYRPGRAALRGRTA